MDARVKPGHDEGMKSGRSANALSANWQAGPACGGSARLLRLPQDSVAAPSLCKRRPACHNAMLPE